MLPFDLHVLSVPPAFNLSQDQTLQFNPNYALAYLYLFVLLTQRHPKMPTQFVSIFLIIAASSQVLCILPIHTLLSTLFL